MSILDDMPAEQEGDEPWFIESKDRDPLAEFDRQRSFLAKLQRAAPAVDAVAIPNAGRASDWERIRRWNEGARKGALDLVITWKPTRPDDRGVFFPEFKDGQKMPSPAQRERLNRLYRMGHGCGVYRTPGRLIAHLRAAGAPFLDQDARSIGELVVPVVTGIALRLDHG
jgi:hypothetical protein